MQRFLFLVCLFEKGSYSEKGSKSENGAVVKKGAIAIEKSRVTSHQTLSLLPPIVKNKLLDYNKSKNIDKNICFHSKTV